MEAGDSRPAPPQTDTTSEPSGGAVVSEKPPIFAEVSATQDHLFGEVVGTAPEFNHDAEISTLQPNLSDIWMPAQDHVFASQAGTYFGVDCIDISAISGLQFYWCAGYAGGWWPTFHPLCVAYPALYKAGRIFSYAVSEVEDADLCDCERGDLDVSQVVPWLSRQFARGHKKPGVYASLDTWLNGGLKDATNHYGGNIRRIVAWYTYDPSIREDWSDCQQYTDHYANRNVDGNVAKASMFVTGPPVVNKWHYERFPTGPFPTHRWGNLNEQLIVEEYDGARRHPDKFAHYLPQLEARLHWLAGRCAHEAIDVHKLPNGKPNWADNYYGWRYQQLIHRAQGVRIVK